MKVAHDDPSSELVIKQTAMAHFELVNCERLDLNKRCRRRRRRGVQTPRLCLEGRATNKMHNKLSCGSVRHELALCGRKGP